LTHCCWNWCLRKSEKLSSCRHGWVRNTVHRLKKWSQIYCTWVSVCMCGCVCVGVWVSVWVSVWVWVGCGCVGVGEGVGMGGYVW